MSGTAVEVPASCPQVPGARARNRPLVGTPVGRCGSEQMVSHSWGMIWTVPDSLTNPSQVTDAYWVFAEISGRGPSNPATCGKWQVFVPRDRVDDAWSTIATLVERGELGPSAKVSTAKENSNSSSGPQMHVLIVYAADWRDIDDLRRILRALRANGLADGWVHFKRDLETYAGAYVNRGSKSVSVWNAKPESDEISTKWIDGKRLVVTPENTAEVVAAIEAQDGPLLSHLDLPGPAHRKP